MRDKRENMKKTLGISEYPWSSDDDENETQGGSELQSTQQRNEPDSRSSVADNPGTSGQQSNAGQSSSLRDQTRQLFLSFPSTSSRRTPTLTFRRNREEMPLSLVSRGDGGGGGGGGAGVGSADVQRILAFRKLNRAPAGLRPLSGFSHRHTQQRVGVGASRENRYQPHASPSLASAMSLRRAQHNASLEYGNNEARYSEASVRSDLAEVLREMEQGLLLQSRRAPHAPHAPHATHATHAPHAPVINGPIDSQVNGSLSNMQPVNLSDDGFLEPDLQLNVPPADEGVEISVNEADPALEVNLSSGSGSGQGDDGGEGGGGAHVSSLSLDEVVEIDAEPPAQATDQLEDAQEPVANTSSTNDAVAAGQPHGIKRKRESDDDDIVDLGTVKDFNQSLLRLLECPVCLEWMEPPMWQCRRGHLVCGRCRARLQACPVCRTAFSSVRNRAMEGVAEMLRYPCRHGCGRDLQLRRRAAHEASCLARRYRCPAPVCASRPPLAHRDLAHHFQSKHLSMVKLGRSHKFSMRVNSEQHDNWIILALGQLFHLRVDVDIQTWGVVVYVAYIGPKCNADDYTYEVAVTGQHNARKLVYTRSTHCDLECSSLNVSRQDCFHLTLDQALNFLRVRNRHAEPDKYLHFSVDITHNRAAAAPPSPLPPADPPAPAAAVAPAPAAAPN